METMSSFYVSLHLVHEAAVIAHTSLHTLLVCVCVCVCVYVCVCVCVSVVSGAEHILPDVWTAALGQRQTGDMHTHTHTHTHIQAYTQTRIHTHTHTHTHTHAHTNTGI